MVGGPVSSLTLRKPNFLGQQEPESLSVSNVHYDTSSLLIFMSSDLNTWFLSYRPFLSKWINNCHSDCCCINLAAGTRILPRDQYFQKCSTSSHTSTPNCWRRLILVWVDWEDHWRQVTGCTLTCRTITFKNRATHPLTVDSAFFQPKFLCLFCSSIL